MPSLKSGGTAITILLCLAMTLVTMSHLEASAVDTVGNSSTVSVTYSVVAGRR